MKRLKYVNCLFYSIYIVWIIYRYYFYEKMQSGKDLVIVIVGVLIFILLLILEVRSILKEKKKS